MFKNEQQWPKLDSNSASAINSVVTEDHETVYEKIAMECPNNVILDSMRDFGKS